MVTDPETGRSFILSLLKVHISQAPVPPGAYCRGAHFVEEPVIGCAVLVVLRYKLATQWISYCHSFAKKVTVCTIRYQEKKIILFIIDKS